MLVTKQSPVYFHSETLYPHNSKHFNRQVLPNKYLDDIEIFDKLKTPIT